MAFSIEITTRSAAARDAVQRCIAESNLQGDVTYGPMTEHGSPVIRILTWSESVRMIFAGRLTLDLPEVTFNTSVNVETEVTVCRIIC